MIFRTMIAPKALLFAGATAILLASGCSSDDAATKDDAAATDEPKAEEPMEEPAAEEPAAEEPAETAGPDMAIYERAAKITEGKTAAGGFAVRLKNVTADGGYAACGLQDGDIVATVDGAEVPTGRAAVDAINNACAHKKPIMVERGGESVTLGGE